MWLAYKIFEIAQMADGQESSTRYIAMDAANVSTAEELGIPGDLGGRWRDVLARSFAAYHAEYARLDGLAAAEPQRVKVSGGREARGPGASPQVLRPGPGPLFHPVCDAHESGLVQSSRMWAQTVKHLDSLPQPEARTAARLVRDELLKQSPRLMRHSFAEDSYAEQSRQELAASLALGRARISAAPLSDEVWMKVDRSAPPWLPETQPVAEALRYRPIATASRAWRRAGCGCVSMEQPRARRTARSEPSPHGRRFTPLIQAGFYLPPEIRHRDHARSSTTSWSSPGPDRSRLAGVCVFAASGGSDSVRARHPRRQVHLRGRAAHRDGSPFPLRRAPQRGASGVLTEVPEARDWVVEGTAEPE